jgi:hypothetical protein
MIKTTSGAVVAVDAAWPKLEEWVLAQIMAPQYPGSSRSVPSLEDQARNDSPQNLGLGHSSIHAGRMISTLATLCSTKWQLTVLLTLKMLL